MKIAGSTVLITGANRGVGRAFAHAAVSRGAKKVYGAARDSSTVAVDGVVPIELDVTDSDSVARVAAVAGDVDLLINNAGVTTYAPIVAGDLDDLRLEIETNYFGTLAMVRAFAPILAAHGGGAVLNVSSVMAWLGMAQSGGYSASKAAVWAMSNSLRVELAGQGTLVTSLLMASTDTDMMADFDVPKNNPADVVAAALDGIEAGRLEVLADAHTRSVHATLSGRRELAYPGVVQW